MQNIKAITAALLLLTAAGAYAGTDDGNVQGNVSIQTARQQAPAPSPSAAETEVRTLDSGIVSPNP
ncbi:MAG TPA: hypothetical protein VH105_19390 [Burkholderiales bacterium]|jgi:hypothetical protein|nr:hypothetical protein [Burkholderiales bacterium]